MQILYVAYLLFCIGGQAFFPQGSADQLIPDVVVVKGGQTAILVRWSAAQWTTEMLADQQTGKNSGPAPADYRN
jgi:hypothetical protein